MISDDHQRSQLTELFTEPQPNSPSIGPYRDSGIWHNVTIRLLVSRFQWECVTCSDDTPKQRIAS
jgi:hypothetical protein